MCDNNQDTDNIKELNSSILGTQEYWEQFYSKENENFNDIGDHGEIWFGENSEQRIINFLEREDEVNESSSILDIGCGNGHLCLELVKEGYISVCGIDYSPMAITLAKSIAEGEGYSDKVIFQVRDIVEEARMGSVTDKYDVVIDKGTYDAISLCPEDAMGMRKYYQLAIADLVKIGGLFIITSCNWSLEELKSHFLSQIGESKKKSWTLYKVMPSKTFQFQGVTGRDTTCVIFKNV